jgi:hypothetical protein
MKLTMDDLDRVRAAEPEKLRHLADPEMAGVYAKLVLRDVVAAAEFGTDAGAVARLAAILRHDYGGAPIGSLPGTA